MSLKQMFIEALERKNETLDDVIVISHPIEVLDKISTLEEIQCFYVNGAGCGYTEDGEPRYGITDPAHKQDMPFIAATRRNIYFAQFNQQIENPRISELPENERWIAANRFVDGVECYSRDDA